jgi:hypothetical protein
MQNFGRVIEFLTANMSFSSDRFAIDGRVPFDNDMLPNESEVRIYNLSDQTLTKIKRGNVAMVNAGYKGDIGMIMLGWISRVVTRWEGVDKITTINILDSEDLSKRQVKEAAYAKGTLASYIIRDLARVIGMPIAQMELHKDVKYNDGYTVKGKATDLIADIAKECETSAFINRGKLYIRNLRRIAGSDLFALSKKTGLIGSPSTFEDAGTTGYNVKSQLQYRITTASGIDLTSSLFTGRLYVRKGTHIFSRDGDFTTEVEAVL